MEVKNLQPGQIFNIYQYESSKNCYVTGIDQSTTDKDFRIQYAKNQHAVAAFKIKELKQAS